MTSTQMFSRALLLLTLHLTGCAVDAPSEQDGSDAAWAAVQAGQCTPDCNNRVCGLDPICGISCGECRSGQSCDEAVGQCKAECVPDCSRRACGLDPVCGVSCGTCTAGASCEDTTGICQAKPTKPPEPPKPPKHQSCLKHKRHHGKR